MHPPNGPAWLVWLETSGIGVAMRQWTWLYPAVEIAHIVGFVTLVGAALMFDARLLGRSRPLAVSALERHLLPWARWSLLLVVPTGALMFAAHATEMATNPALRLKLVLLVAAFLNRRRLGHGAPRAACRACHRGAVHCAVARRHRLRPPHRLFLTSPRRAAAVPGWRNREKHFPSSRPAGPMV